MSFSHTFDALLPPTPSPSPRTPYCAFERQIVQKNIPGVYFTSNEPANKHGRIQITMSDMTYDCGTVQWHSLHCSAYPFI
jgi:hypothetical protein